MITRNDCLILLADLEKKNIDTKEITNELFASNQVPINVIKFIVFIVFEAIYIFLFA